MLEYMKATQNESNVAVIIMKLFLNFGHVLVVFNIKYKNRLMWLFDNLSWYHMDDSRPVLQYLPRPAVSTTDLT